jgi:hypothetical protein
MSKKVDFDKIDEKLIVASVRKDRTIIPENKSAEVAPEPVATDEKPEQSEQQEQLEQSEQTDKMDRATEMEIISIPSELPKTSPEPPKEEVRRKRKSQDYENMFIKESNITARLGKTVYIRKEFHDRILKIVQVIGDNEVSLFSYIDNIIAHHFDMFQDEISQSYRQKNKDIF